MIPASISSLSTAVTSSQRCTGSPQHIAESAENACCFIKASTKADIVTEKVRELASIARDVQLLVLPIGFEELRRRDRSQQRRQIVCSHRSVAPILFLLHHFHTPHAASPK